jgi:hypothetical protein
LPPNNAVFIAPLDNATVRRVSRLLRTFSGGFFHVQNHPPIIRTNPASSLWSINLLAFLETLRANVKRGHRGRAFLMQEYTMSQLEPRETRNGQTMFAPLAWQAVEGIKDFKSIRTTFKMQSM